MEIKTHNQTIHETRSYKYLGIDLDNHLNLHQHFDNVYKKASARVKLLPLIREKVNPYVAESIYRSMIYCVVLPKMRTETGKKSFAFQGAHIFNRLEKTTRDEVSIVLLKQKLELSKYLQMPKKKTFLTLIR